MVERPYRRSRYVHDQAAGNRDASPRRKRVEKHRGGSPLSTRSARIREQPGHPHRRAGLEPFRFDQETKARIWSAIQDKIRGRLKHGASLGDILFSSERDLEKATRAEGFDPPPGLCAVPAHLVKKEKVYGRSSINSSATKSDSRMARRVFARFIGRTPMRIVVGDVHPSDIILQKVDGYQRYAKADLLDSM